MVPVLKHHPEHKPNRKANRAYNNRVHRNTFLIRLEGNDLSLSRSKPVYPKAYPPLQMKRHSLLEPALVYQYITSMLSSGELHRLTCASISSRSVSTVKPASSLFRPVPQSVGQMRMFHLP